MKKILQGCVVSVVFFSSFAAAAPDKGKTDLVRQCRDSLLATFPETKVERIEDSPLPGICEVAAGTNVLYFRPNGANGLLIAGAIVDKTGRNYTEEKSQILLEDKINTLPLHRSIIRGEGPVTVVIYTDVDCPFCRGLEKDLSQYQDLAQKATIHTFLYPLSMHPKAKDKSRWVLCQPDKNKAFRDVINGALDDEGNKAFYPIECSSPEAETFLAAALDSGKSLGLTGTPSIFVNGTQIRGNAEIVYAAINRAFQKSLTSGGLAGRQ